MNKKITLALVVATFAVIGVTLWQAQTMRDPAIKISEDEAVTENEQLDKVAGNVRASSSEKSADYSASSEGSQASSESNDPNLKSTNPPHNNQ